MADRVIHILPEQVASQIAAGEVVERPASAVKELCENSLDAGARSIAVEIKGGGTALLAVTDDGCGMGPHDAVLALRRHATSKIRDAADLLGIHSLGFRGEALAALASVSKLELKTRQATDQNGIHLSVSGGELTARAECAMAPGTRIEAHELFFNTPARLKFLKTPVSEQAAVLEALQRLALGCPGVAFALDADGRRLLEVPKANSLLERARQLFGPKLAAQMLPLACAREGIRIEGLISQSQESFSSARMMFTFVNGRAIRDKLLIRAIGNAYATLLPRGRYPAVMVTLTLRAQEVDVNVHPMKAEVRFRHSAGVFEAVYRALRERLADQTGAAQGAVPAGGPQAAPLGADRAALSLGKAQGPDGAIEPNSAPALDSNLALAVGPSDMAPGAPSRLRLVFDRAEARPPSQSPLGLGFGNRLARPADSGALPAPEPGAGGVDGRRPLPEGPGLPELGQAHAPNYSELHVIGQLFAGYVALESEEGLLLVDQHAAHERVTFEKLKRQLQAGHVEVQQRLIPETLELSPARAARITPALPRLQALGFDLEPFGANTLLLKGTPAVFGPGAGLQLLRDMLEGLEEISAGAEGFESLLKQLACHGSIRVGRTLSRAEIDALLGELDQTPFKTNCPHGRPVHIRFARGQIERMFRRS